MAADRSRFGAQSADWYHGDGLHELPASPKLTIIRAGLTRTSTLKIFVAKVKTRTGKIDKSSKKRPVRGSLINEKQTTFGHHVVLYQRHLSSRRGILWSSSLVGYTDQMTESKIHLKIVNFGPKYVRVTTV